jgi:hypothetical protein
VKVTVQVSSDFTVRFHIKDTENYTLKYSFQHMPGQSQKMYSSQPELNDNWTKVSNKRSRSTQEEPEIKAKHAKQNEHWLNQVQQKAGPENTPKPPIYITNVTNISPLI